MAPPGTNQSSGGAQLARHTSTMRTPLLFGALYSHMQREAAAWARAPVGLCLAGRVSSHATTGVYGARPEDRSDGSISILGGITRGNNLFADGSVLLKSSNTC